MARHAREPGVKSYRGKASNRTLRKRLQAVRPYRKQRVKRATSLVQLLAEDVGFEFRAGTKKTRLEFNSKKAKKPLIYKGFFSVLAERVSVALSVKNPLDSALSTFLSTFDSSPSRIHYAPTGSAAGCATPYHATALQAVRNL